MKRTRPEAVRAIVAKSERRIVVTGTDAGMVPETAAALRELIEIGRRARMA